MNNSTLPTELESVAKEICNETPGIRESSLVSLQLWLKKTRHLKSRNNEAFLLAFLRYCRFSLEETKKRMNSYYSLKMGFPEVLMNRTLDESLMALYRQGVHIIPMKPLTPDGPRIIISQFRKYDPKKFAPKDVLKLLFMLFELLANEDANASVAGIVYIVDYRDVTMDHMRQYDLFLLKKTWALFVHCLPLRFVGIHLINMRKNSQSFFKFVRSFLPDEIPIKFTVHKKAEDLYEHIPREAMTVEYGGHNGYQAEALQHWENVMVSYKDYFAQDDNYGTNEKLRIGKTASMQVSQLTGLKGSFRQLSVD